MLDLIVKGINKFLAASLNADVNKIIIENRPQTNPKYPHIYASGEGTLIDVTMDHKLHQMHKVIEIAVAVINKNSEYANKVIKNLRDTLERSAISVDDWNVIDTWSSDQMQEPEELEGETVIKFTFHVILERTIEP